MTDPMQLLQQAAGQLKREGKNPSLALFRARLAGQLTPQQLFAAYQHWRSNPIYTDASVGESAPQPAEQNADQVDDLHQQLNRIEAKLDLLLSKLGNS